MTEYCTIYVTCRDKAEAKNICKSLLSEKLVACGNIIDGATSIY
ncbi:divalent-cation tolerance protein CutA [Pseudemcibacter aquimaris]|nr:divalent-cation tolerance protein CutA [Pseudemcibacter aquimaris]